MTRAGIAADGTYIVDSPVTLPDVLDVLIVGGGPFGTATAFRARELGLAALVIDSDDLMKRIRDYSKSKPIFPSYGGGDNMQFPEGGELIRSLRFDEIDKDELCARWKALYRTFGVAAQVGIEMTGFELEEDLWKVFAWNQNISQQQTFRARHVVLALGRGEPRRLDIPGDAEGLAFALSDPALYVGEPVCVFGGGTSAAEAVIEISRAKSAAKDSTAVYWSHRGSDMPKVSRALADRFFDAFMMRGNVRYLPNSEPTAFGGAGPQASLFVRTSTVSTPGAPSQTSQLEFRKQFCIACIGADIPERLLAKLGTPLVTGGPSNEKRCVVTPGLETRQRNVYLAGDVLHPAYFETALFDADPSQFREIKRKGNIKAALRDGVVVADVIKQKLEGRRLIDVSPFVGGPLSSSMAGRQTWEADAARCTLVALMPNGLEVNEYRLRKAEPTTIGRGPADISFPADEQMAALHAQVTPTRNGFDIEDKSSQGVFVQPGISRTLTIGPGAIIRAGQQWLVVSKATSLASLAHHDSSGRQLAIYTLGAGTTIVGRESPDITIAPDDQSLSRRHLSVILDQGELAVRDLGSANGTQVKVRGRMRVMNGDRILVGRQVLRFDDGRTDAQPSERVRFQTGQLPQMSTAFPAPGESDPAGPRTASAAMSEGASPSAVASAPEPVLTFADGRRAACESGTTILAAAEKGGISIDSECGIGTCGMDVVRVLSGAAALSEMGDTERKTLKNECKVDPRSHRLACMARVRGPVTIALGK